MLALFGKLCVCWSVKFRQIVAPATLLDEKGFKQKASNSGDSGISCSIMTLFGWCFCWVFLRLLQQLLPLQPAPRTNTIVVVTTIATARWLRLLLILLGLLLLAPRTTGCWPSANCDLAAKGHQQSCTLLGTFSISAAASGAHDRESVDSLLRRLAQNRGGLWDAVVSHCWLRFRGKQRSLSICRT